MRTFDEAFSEHRLTPAERRELVFHLASLRARKTIEALLPCSACGLPAGLDPRDLGLRSGPDNPVVPE